MAEAAFSVSLEDHVSAGAKSAAGGIAHLKHALEEGKEGLVGFTKELLAVQEPVETIRHAFESAEEGLDNFAKGLKSGEISEAVSGLTETVAGLASALDLVVPGLGQVASAVIKVAGTIVAATVGIVQAMVEMSLDVSAENEIAAASFEALGSGVEGSGEKMLAMVDDLAAHLPQAESKLAEWTKAIEATGETDIASVRHELIATASASALLGEKGAASYEKIQAAAKKAADKHIGLKLADKKLPEVYEGDVAAKMGMTIGQLGAKLKAGTVDAKKFSDALSSAVIERGKGPLDAMMNSIGTIIPKAKETLGHLFDGIDTKPLTDALRLLFEIGDQGKPSGAALHSGIQSGMNGVIKALASGVHSAKIFFLTVELRALQAHVALLPIIYAVEKISKAYDGIKGLGAKLGGASDKAAGAEKGTTGQVMSEALWSALPGYMTGKAIALGLEVSSSIASAQALENAHAGGVKIGQATEAGMKEGLQVKSPSRVAMRIGMQVSEGLGMGMTDSSAPARAARTVSGDALGGLKGGAGGMFGGGSGGQGGATIGPIHIAITAPDGVTGAHELSMVGLSTALERYQIGSGR